MTAKMNERSERNMVGVHPVLVAVARKANEICKAKYGFEITFIEGLRTDARQLELYAQGRTTKGPIVTWTLESKHKRQASGFGEAIDGAHISGKSVLWNDCDKIAKCMFEAADMLSAKIRWGADWDMDGKPREKGETDSPHFELAR
jgi:peptidoglycan L-alanyl-D-glutamate endopeptidase CwlK